VLSVADHATAASPRPAERFDELFRQFYPRLVPVAERLLGDRAEAEDIVQEAFLRLARSGQDEHSAQQHASTGSEPIDADTGETSFDRPDIGQTAPLLERPTEAIGAWLRRVVLNLGVNRLRDRRRADARLLRASRLDTAFDPERNTGQDDNPSHALLRAEARNEVRAALVALPERQRSCLLLRHAGHSYAEIAAALGIAIGSVGVYLARGERAFRAAYRRDEAADSPDTTQGTTP
jgi:RNA polymerase sigma-70 factor (ECF subfamily)